MTDLRLHIGGHEIKVGWVILDVQPGDGVDFVGACTDLSQFAAGSVAEIYCSHVLEHLSHRGELQTALGEFFRVLKPGGMLRVSVPDLDMLCRLFVSPEVTPVGRLNLMMMMFGGQQDAHDFHKSGLWPDFLATYLHDAGFIDMARVPEFGLFDDTSSLKFGGNLISLNVAARHP
jgi:predicted SAM-dependent methyltransferase